MNVRARRALYIFLLITGQALSNTIVVNTELDQNDSPAGAQVSLREAIRDAGTNAATICFAPSMAGKRIALESLISDVQAGGKITIDGSTTNGSPPIIVPGSGMAANSRLFQFTKRDFRVENVVLDGEDNLSTGVLGHNFRIELHEVEVRNFTNVAVSMNYGGEFHIWRCYFHNNNKAISAGQLGSGEIFGSLFCFNRDSSLKAATTSNTSLLRIRNSTFAENTGIFPTIDISGDGPGNQLIHCSIVDNNSPGLKCPQVTQLIGNLFARNVPLLSQTGTPESIVVNGVSGATSAGYNLSDEVSSVLNHAEDQTGGVVRVSRLGDYGGSLMCCFPLAGSRAIEGGIPNRTFPLLSSDVRGFDRKSRTASNGLSNIIDIGAVEVNPEGTLVVTNNFITGAGSLRNTLLAATGETAHIVFTLPIGSRVINVPSTHVIDSERNYNIDASTLGVTLVSNTASEALFQCGDATGGETSVSFQKIKFTGFDADASGGPRGCVMVRSDAKVSLHDCQFEDNTSAVAGVVNVHGGKLFANECTFSGNNLIRTVSDAAPGGAAIRNQGGNITVWNSTFVANTASQTNMSGGAVRMEPVTGGVAVSRFKQCTFVRNDARNFGSVLHAEDSSYGSVRTALVFDRCTFSHNNTIKGAISLQGRMKMECNANLFHANTNGHSLIQDPATRDLRANTPSGVVIESKSANWTDSPQAFGGLVDSNHLNIPFKLAPLTSWGGRVHTAPLIEASAGTIISETVSWLYHPRDSRSTFGYVQETNPHRFFTVPGATQQMVQYNDFIQTRVLSKDSSNLRLRVTGKSNVTWEVYTSTNLNNFSPTGITVSGLSIIAKTVQVPIPASNPDKFFVRFVEVHP